MGSGLSRTFIGVLILLIASPIFAATFTVDTDGSSTDITINGTCAATGGGCTLHAAIQEANATPGADTIQFSIPSVTITASLPQILFPVTIDGGGSRTQLIGGPGLNGITLTAGAGSNTPGGGSTIESLVITNMGGAGISIIGGGNTVHNCYIGTDGTNALPNNGAGISITTPALGPFAQLSDINTVAGNAIGGPSAGQGNVISGNTGVGIDIFAERTVKNIVQNNIIGLNATQSAALPNGSHGIQISGNAFANTIGPANIIAGNTAPTADGINISGAVWQANIVTGNVIGGNLFGDDYGNGLSGIRIETTKYDPSVTWTTEASSNTIIFNNEHGIFITNAATAVWAHGNYIGVLNNGTTDNGNANDGIRITTTGNQIGGTGPGQRNVISGNDDCGIRLQSGSATDNVIYNNLIGRDSLNVQNIPNINDGVFITNSAGNNTIGGSGVGEANIIAGNGRHGIKLYNASSSNFITANSIWSNGVLTATGLGIDLDQVDNGKDSTTNATPGVDPNILYSNWGQNAPVITNSGSNVPQYDPSTGNTVVPYTLETAPGTPVRLEFFANDTANPNDSGEGKTYLGTATIITAGDGTFSSSTSVVPVVPIDTRSKFITMTATTTQPIDPPGPSNTGAANNTSEFSNAVLAPNPGKVQLSSATYNVGEAGPFVTITVTRTGGSDGTVMIDSMTSSDTADAGFDFTATSNTLTFNDGETSKTFDVPITDDTIYEGSETFNILLTNPQNYVEIGTPSSAVVTINDNDSQPSMSIDNVTLAEGDAGTTNFVFTVSLSNLSAFGASATVNTADGSATLANNDYAAIVNGNVTIPAGSLTANVTVPVNGDVNVESNESFTVNLTGITGASAGTTTGTGTITNDDNPQPTFSIDDVSLNEGNAGTTAFTFTVSLTPAAASTVSVDVATANNTATAGSDYTTKSQTLTFLAGQVSQMFAVDVNGDTTFEGNESFDVNLTNASAGTMIGDASGSGTIQNDDLLPSISINDVSQLEGNAGTTNFVFTVSLSNPSSQTITVDFATANGSATAPGDYASNANTLTFAPGITTQPITIAVVGETTNESDETFTVNLANASNATILDNIGTGTIQNDDSPTPTFSINSVAQSEGNSGSAAMTFTISLSPAAASTVSVTATTADNTANAGSDYTTSSQLLTFNAGETTKNFAVPILGDTTFESNESFTVNLTGNSAGAALGASSGTGTINNDDTQPSISINDVTQLETNDNTNFVFDVTLSNASSQTITVNFATNDNGATAGSDYTMTSNTLTFNAGEVAKQITVVVTGDATDEPNEQFFVNLSGPSNATLADAQGIGTIINDDSPTPTFSIDSISQNEGNAGTTAFNFTVTLSPVSASATSVNVATSNGTALILDGDYISNSTTLNFPANSPSQQFTVFVNGDTKFEPSETFTATLTSPSAGTQLGLASGTATITNDDAQPSISINDVSQNEGNAGTTNFPFTVSLSNASFQTITVDYATANGSATAGSDYTATSGTITFNSGETSKPLPVSVNGDGTIEGNETFVINLTNPTNASLLDAQGTGTIVEDDSAMPSFSIANVTLNEGNSGTTAFTFTVTLSPTAGSTTTVQATIADGTATSADGDFVALAPVTLTFNAGVVTQQVTVNVNGDTKLENDETFTVTLGSNSVGTTIGSGTATGTITNDDAQPQMLISDPSQFEGNSGTTAFLFTVTLSNPSAFPITVNYLTSNGTATAGSDYTTTSGTLTFPPGSTTQTITVLVNGDLLNEGSETFFVTLSNASGATISDAQATATIQNDPEDAAATATVPMLGARELALLAIALAVVAMLVMKR